MLPLLTLQESAFGLDVRAFLVPTFILGDVRVKGSLFSEFSLTGLPSLPLFPLPMTYSWRYKTSVILNLSFIASLFTHPHPTKRGIFLEQVI